MSVGDGVARSGEMIELLAIFRVDIPLLLLRDSFLGEHLTGVAELDNCFLGVVPPKFSLLGRSPMLMLTGLMVEVMFSTRATSAKFISFLGLLLKPGLRCSRKILALGDREQFNFAVESDRGARGFLLDISPELSNFRLPPLLPVPQPAVSSDSN